jgi:hypothetical protein
VHLSLPHSTLTLVTVSEAREDVHKLSHIQGHKSSMGGVDVKEQKLQPYKHEEKTK